MPDRRFLFGTLSWQQNIGTFTYEFWEGDRLTAPLLRQADAQVKASFFAPVKFKTNSTLHERVAKEAGHRLREPGGSHPRAAFSADEPGPLPAEHAYRG